MRYFFILLLFLLSCGKKRSMNLSQQTRVAAEKALLTISNDFFNQLVRLHPQQNYTINREVLDEWNDKSNAIILRMINVKNDAQMRLKNEVNQDSLNNVMSYITLKTLDLNFNFLTTLNKYWYHLYLDNHLYSFKDEFYSYMTSFPLKNERDVSHFISLLVDTKRKIRSLDKNIEIRINQKIKPNLEIINSLIKLYETEIQAIPNHPVLTYFKENIAFLSQDKQKKYQEDVTYHLEKTYGKYISRYIDQLKTYKNSDIHSEENNDIESKLKNIASNMPILGSDLEFIYKKENILSIYNHAFIEYLDIK